MRSVTPAPPKLDPQPKPTAEYLIHKNGLLIEELFSSEAWRELVFPVLQERIAGASGRLTNGRYHHGSLTSDWKEHNSVFVAGYQKSLMDFYNDLHDFIVNKNRLAEKKKSDAQETKAPLYNPFMEPENDN